MSFEAVDLVIKSGIEEPGEFCVLLALAHCLNDKTGDCFPSTATIAKIARKSPRVVRQSLRSLEERRIVLSTQPPGGVRRFRLCLDAIPANPLYEVQPLAKTQGVNETTPLAETSALPCRKGQGTPVENARGPLSKTTAEQGIEQGIEQGKEQGSLSPLAPASDELALTPEVETPVEKEKPKAKTSRRKPSTPCPWDEGSSIPEELADWSEENFPTIDASEEFRKFIGWALSKDMRYARWDQAFRNWMGNALKYANQRGGYSSNGYRSKRRPTCPGDWEKEFKNVDYTRGVVMKEFTPEESAELNRICEEMGF